MEVSECQNDIIAVFIDGDNISYKYLITILNEIKTYGRIVINNIYCDWSIKQNDNLRQTSINLGISNCHCDKISGKNSTDIKLIVDLMKTLYTMNHISLYYIVTSDSDYRHVIPEIKMKNKKIHVIGKEQSNKSLQNIADLFTKIEVLVQFNNNISNEIENSNSYLSDDSSEDKNDKSEDSNNSKNDDSCNSQKTFKDALLEDNVYEKKKLPHKIRYEIRNIVENNKPNIGEINRILQRKYQFDFREYNCKSMKLFILKYAGYIKCKLHGNEYIELF